MSGHHLAQLNVARMRAPMDSAVMAPFVDALPVINGLGDRSPGFVWRLVDDEGVGATALRPFGDDVIVNLTVWESVEALRDFTLAGEHLAFMRRRREFFHPYGGPYLALWWIESGHVPTVEEAGERLGHLTEHGPTAYAFTLTRSYPPPSERLADVAP